MTVTNAKKILNENGYDIEKSVLPNFDFFIPVPDDEFDDENQIEQSQGTHVTADELIQLAIDETKLSS